MSYDKSTENKAVDMLRNGSKKQFSTVESVVYFL
ncbi:hypothetical protein LMG7974_01937 [Campylobacter majalis]|uniref:Uncharacterized protein n=1 Tax=Campylobacter majalis TaxID=2790656 RepID=A0ABM8QAE1_9BACT|nr:hypothetical protein LMG7974_01937 [Campylobacter majalis]